MKQICYNLVSEQITAMKLKIKYSDTKKEDKQQSLNTVKFLLGWQRIRYFKETYISETSTIPTIRFV